MKIVTGRRSVQIVILKNSKTIKNKNGTSGAYGGPSQQTINKVIFLQSLKVPPQFCKAGSGSAKKTNVNHSPAIKPLPAVLWIQIH